jgi:hypothetical protein
MRRLLFIVALLAASALAPVVHAQTVTGNASYSWELPTTTSCAGVVGVCVPVPLTGANAITSVEGYISTSPIPDEPTTAPTLVLTANATTATYTGPVPNGSTLYARFRANTATAKGLLSAEVSKVIQVDTGPPGQITNVTVTFTITAAEPAPQ